MDTPKKVSAIVAIAAGSVIVFSAVGVGVMTGMIPSSFSTSAQAPAPEAASAPVTAPAPQAPRSHAVAPQPAPAYAPAPAPAPSDQAERRQQRVEARRAARERTQVAAANVCANCGTVSSVNVVEHAGEGSGLGAIGGAVVGGVLGNQVGRGTGRKVATVAGAAGGAYAGHQVEKYAKTTKSWNVAVRMEDGSSRSFPYSSEPGFRSGDPVKIVDGKLAAR